MKPQENKLLQSQDSPAVVHQVEIPVGVRVRSGLHAGQWQCTSCQGQVNGDQLFRPTCSFCQAT